MILLLINIYYRFIIIFGYYQYFLHWLFLRHYCIIFINILHYFASIIFFIFASITLDAFLSLIIFDIDITDWLFIFFSILFLRWWRRADAMLLWRYAAICCAARCQAAPRSARYAAMPYATRATRLCRVATQRSARWRASAADAMPLMMRRARHARTHYYYFHFLRHYFLSFIFFHFHYFLSPFIIHWYFLRPLSLILISFFDATFHWCCHIIFSFSFSLMLSLFSSIFFRCLLLCRRYAYDIIFFSAVRYFFVDVFCCFHYFRSRCFSSWCWYTPLIFALLIFFHYSIPLPAAADAAADMFSSFISYASPFLFSFFFSADIIFLPLRFSPDYFSSFFRFSLILFLFSLYFLHYYAFAVITIFSFLSFDISFHILIFSLLFFFIIFLYFFLFRFFFFRYIITPILRWYYFIYFAYYADAMLLICLLLFIAAWLSIIIDMFHIIMLFRYLQCINNH